MEVSYQVNIKGFETACRALSKISGRSMKDVVEAEVTKILDRTIDYTRQSTPNKIKNRFNTAQFSFQPPGLYAPKTREGVLARARATRSKNGDLLYYLQNRYPTALWHQIESRRQKSLQKKLKAIGLAKKSWWNIGRLLQLPVKAGRFINAIATTGRDYPEDIQVKKSVNEGEIAIGFINAQPTVQLPSVAGGRALQSAVNGRVKYFTTNVKKGVFDSLKNIARAYPGLKLTE